MLMKKMIEKYNNSKEIPIYSVIFFKTTRRPLLNKGRSGRKEFLEMPLKKSIPYVLH